MDITELLNMRFLLDFLRFQPMARSLLLPETTDLVRSLKMQEKMALTRFADFIRFADAYVVRRLCSVHQFIFSNHRQSRHLCRWGFVWDAAGVFGELGDALAGG